MMISSRTRYGMRAILMLAQHYGKAPLQIKMIAENEDISPKYLEQLIRILKLDGLLRSVRGPRGGYALTRPPEEIKLKQIFLAFEGPLMSTDCAKHSKYSSDCPDCKTNRVLQKIHDSLTDVLESITLADLADGKL